MEELNIWKQHVMGGVSRKIPFVLNAIGFSEKTRTTVSDCVVLNDAIVNISNALTDCVYNAFTIGSRCEGTTNRALLSDNDIVHYSPLVKVYESVRKQTICPLNTHLITVKDTITPNGYTKLQLVQNGEIILTEHEINHEYHIFEEFKFDTSGRLVLSNDRVRYTEITVHERNGPADTIIHGNQIAEDHVRAYQFDEIPNALKPWFKRPRPYAWPSKETLKLFNRMGCFVVPAGQPDSPEKNLEWRLSMSFQERHIMLNLNETQYKCYILLKLIKKFLIKPQFGDVISSYHCKTSLFYTIEGNENEIWTTEYLLMNLIKCLKQLLQWIRQGYCPNFFVPEENMFASKFSKETQDRLEQFIDNFISCNCFDLLKIEFENFGQLLSLNEDMSYNNAYKQLENEISCAWYVHASLCVVGKRVIFADLLDTIEEWKVLNDKAPMYLNLLVSCYPKINMNELPEGFLTEGLDPTKFCFLGLYGYCLSGDILKMISNKLIYNLMDIFQVYAKRYFSMYIKYNELCFSEIENNETGECFIPIEQAMRFIAYRCLELRKFVSANANLGSAKIEYSRPHEKQLVLKGINLATTKLLTDIACLLAAEYVRTKNVNESKLTIFESLKYFKMGQSVNFVTNRLKFSRMLYIQQMYIQSHELLNNLVSREKDTFHSCICYEEFNFNGNQTRDSKIKRIIKKGIELKEKRQIKTANEDRLIELLASNFTNCVIYDLYELNVIDAPVCYEAFRSFGTAPDSRKDLQDFWFDRVVITPVVYLHFMLIECSDQLNDRAGSAASLGVLENLLFITCDKSLRHFETAINLVGHVYLKKGWTKLAIKCFRKSLKVCSLHNAAKWNIMFMLLSQLEIPRSA